MDGEHLSSCEDCVDVLPCGVFELAPSANIVSVLYRAPLAVCGALRGVGAAGMRHTVSRGSVEGSVKRCVHAMLIVVRVLTDRRDTRSRVVWSEFSRTEQNRTDSFLVSPSVHQEQKSTVTDTSCASSRLKTRHRTPTFNSRPTRHRNTPRREENHTHTDGTSTASIRARRP